MRAPQRESLFGAFDTPVVTPQKNSHLTNDEHASCGVLAPKTGPKEFASPARHEAHAHVLKTLNQREIATFLSLCDYLDATKYPDVTGGELAAWSNTDKCSVRPRLSEMHDKGWLHRHPIRASRANELRCEPYSNALPRAAIARLFAKGTP